MKTLVLSLLLLSSLSFGACASICERKDNWLAKNCPGTDVSSSPDPTCEDRLADCEEGQLAQARGYVECLEKQNQCSMDIMAACQAQFPNGVNVSCPKKS